MSLQYHKYCHIVCFENIAHTLFFKATSISNLQLSIHSVHRHFFDLFLLPLSLASCFYKLVKGAILWLKFSTRASCAQRQWRTCTMGTEAVAHVSSQVAHAVRRVRHRNALCAQFSTEVRCCALDRHWICLLLRCASATVFIITRYLN